MKDSRDNPFPVKMSFPNWLNVETAVPLGRVNLDEASIDMLLERAPDPPGVGKTALKVARRDILKRAREELLGTRIIRDQRGFRDLKRSIFNKDMDGVKDAYMALSKELRFRRRAISREGVEAMKRDIAKKSPPVPDPRAQREFEEEFLKSFSRGFVSEGLDVGTLAGMALGQPTSQMVLSAFHTTNESMDDSFERFPRLKAILGASKTNKFPKSFICFKEEGKDYASFQDVVHTGRTFDEVYARKSEMEEVTLHTVSIANNLIDRGDLQEKGIEDMIEMHNVFFPQKVPKLERASLDDAAEIELDPFYMYFYGLTMSKVADAVERGSGMVCVWTSQSVKGDPNAGKLFVLDPSGEPGSSALYKSIILAADKIKIGGYEGIRKILPRKENILRILYREESLGDAKWNFFVDDHATRSGPISAADAERSLREGFPGDDVSVTREDDKITFRIRDASRFIGVSEDSQIKQVDGRARWLVRPKRGEDLNVIAERLRKERGLDAALKRDYLVISAGNMIDYVKRRTPAKAKTFYSAITQGINFNDISQRDDIDLTRFHTNDISGMQRQYGMHISKFLISNELTNIVLSISDSTNVSYMNLIVDSLFQTGRLTGVTYYGAKDRRAGPLAISSLNRATEVFAAASAVGEEEEIQGYTSSVHVGALAKVGTGMVNVKTDEERATEIKREIEESEKERESAALDIVGLFEDIEDIEEKEEVIETVPPIGGGERYLEPEGIQEYKQDAVREFLNSNEPSAARENLVDPEEIPEGDLENLLPLL